MLNARSSFVLFLSNQHGMIIDYDSVESDFDELRVLLLMEDDLDTEDLEDRQL